MTMVAARPGARLLRDTTSSTQVEALIIVAVTTILLTRLYLTLTGFPQVGGATLHIAHVLWGGLLMVVALVVLMTFLGRPPHRVAVLAGGIGFGLFLDEIGKFVTKSNDYFYKPAVAIMYVVVVLLLIANRALHAVRGVSAEECLANAATTATDGMLRGLTPTARDQAWAQLGRARAGGMDPAVVDRIEELVARCPEGRSRTSAVTTAVALWAPERLCSARGAWFVAVLLTLFSAGMLTYAVVTLSEDLAEDRGDLMTVLQLLGSATTTVLCVVGVVGLRRGRRWALRILRTAALITVLFVDVVNFAVQEFGGLINVAVGATALGVFSYRLRQVYRHEPLADTA